MPTKSLFRKWRSVGVLLLLALSASLIGCGSSDKGAGSSASPTGDPIRAYAGTTLRIALEDVAPTTTIRQLIPEFEKETGINVEEEVYDETTLRQKLVLDYTSHGATYSLAHVQWWFIPEFANAGYLVPVDSLVSKYGSVEKWYNPKDFPGRIIDGYKFKGTIYGLPHWFIGGMYYYRTDLFSKQGWQAPQNLADMMTLAQKTKSAYGNQINGWTGRGNRDFGTFGSIAGWAAGYGAKLLDDSYHPTLTTDPAWKQAMTDWVGLMQNYAPSGAGNLSWYDTYQGFEAGRVSQFFETSDYGPSFENPKESKVVGNTGYMPMPVGPAGKNAQWFYSAGLAVNKDASPEEQGAAWLFMQWRTSAATMAEELSVPDSPRFDVPSVTVLNSPEYLQAAKAANQEAYAKGLRETFLIADPWYWPAVPQFIQISEVFATNISAAISKQMTVDEALQKSNTQIEAILQKAGYYN